MKNYVDKYVCCPFYSQEEPLKLHCEGYCKGTRLHIVFDCMERKKSHKKKYCDGLATYKECPFYTVINKQYEEDEDDE